MEALHARGFTTTGSILDLPESSFTRAVIGTVAYKRAPEIYALAQDLPWEPDDQDTPPGTSFQPINPGSLVDCVPPCHLSPFGPIQYLYDLLQVSDGQSTIRNVLRPRRGDLGTLQVTSANQDIALPIVDMVNESLEGYAFGLTQDTYAPQVYNTLDIGLTELDIAGAEPLQVANSLSATDLPRALPQHSTPHPLASPNIYEQLKTVVLRPQLPYSQGLDVGRTYIQALGASRFETLRTFQKDITELPQDAALEPADFQRNLWRLPVRRDVAIEYLCMSPEEASIVFGGVMPTTTALQMLGITNGRLPTADTISQVTFFLDVTGLSYCEFLDLHKSRIVVFRPDMTPPAEDFPPCLPCCPGRLRMAWESDATLGEFLRMVIFARLWQRLQGRCREGIPMSVLADICRVIGLFDIAGTNPDFIIQLSSLLMLKEMWNLPWTDPETFNINAIQPDLRTQLLALWSGAAAATQRRRWAVEALLKGVERYSMDSFHYPQRSASWRRIIAENLDDIAGLAGFDGTAYRWDSKPTCTIRFVEVISKLYASNFTIGEVQFLFTNNPHLRDDDPYPRTEEDESLDDPLDVPEDDATHGLWALRRKLLDVHVSDDDACHWTWTRTEATLREMGFGEQFDRYGTPLAEHFFPEILQDEGHTVTPAARRFETTLPDQAATADAAALWACSPFHIELRDEQPSLLWTRLPVCDADVLRSLRDLRQLNQEERRAVQNLYLAPRAALTPFAFILSNFGRAAEYMIQEPCVYKRWRFFQHEFSLFIRRCRIVAHHIHDAVVAAANIDSAECHFPEKGGRHLCAGARVAWEILLRLIADGNQPWAPWEDDSGARPPDDRFDIVPQLTGGAFAALLGLTGTGLLGEYTGRYGASWTETRGGLSGWGMANNYWNSPIVTVLPRLDLVADQHQSLFASFKNGFALDQDTGDVLTGAETFTVTWSGILLVENDGCYHFAMRCPKYCDDDNGACYCEKRKQWSLTLQRGEKTWSLLQQGLDEEETAQERDIPVGYSKPVPLRRGTYDMTVKFRQPEPDFDDPDDLVRFHTGFILKYTGPDTNNCLIEVPHKNLYLKDHSGRLQNNDETGPNYEGIYSRYITSLRDIRRTYQRAFKSVLFAHRFCLSACPSACGWESELGYLLSHPDKFHGVSYYLDDEGGFLTHAADFDFNLLPVGDAYLPPVERVDQRVAPSWKRSAALFDWFERIFDYTRLKSWVREVCEPPVWLLFHHADADSPQPVSQLVRFLNIDIALARLSLEYFEPPDTVWEISDTDNITALADERWATRVWLAGRYVERLKKHFYAPISEIAYCRPALWTASPDGNTEVDGETGNTNLMRFVQRSALSQTDAPPRLGFVIALNDTLRLRARTALLAFLAAHGHSAVDLADYLLLDIETGISEATTRIDDAVSTAQRFIQRVILGLEGAEFQVDEELRKRRECELVSFEQWQAVQRRKWYYENWVHWEETAKLSKSEGFESLKKSLSAGISTFSQPARGQYWSQGNLTGLTGKSSVASAEAFGLSNQQNALDEGLRVLGTPDHSAKTTWLANVPELVTTPPTNPDDDDEPVNFAMDRAASKSSTSEINTADSTEGSPAALSVLPGFEALDHIPLWIQAAVRLGKRFLRIAASGLPIAAPYAVSPRSSPCCVCKEDHAPVVDEYYFWLEDARHFDAADAPAPQNADIHEDTPEVDVPAGPGPQMDPRTREADPTSDWDAPTPQMLAWKPQPLVHLRWMRVHRGLLLDPRRSTQGIPLNENQLSSLHLDLVGRTFDSLVFSLFENDQTPGFRYDIATDSTVVLPEAITSTNPPALPLPASLTGPLTAFPYFLYFEPGAPLVPVGTFGTSLVVAQSLKADCHFEEASDWVRLAFDPLGRDNSWMQCEEEDTGTPSPGPEEDGNDIPDDDINPFIMSPRNDRGREAAAGDADVPCCPTAPVKPVKARGRAATLEYLEILLEWADTLRCSNSLEASQQALTVLSVAERILGPNPNRTNASDNTNGSMTVGTFAPYAAPLNPRLMELYYRAFNASESLTLSLNKRRLRNGQLGRDLAHFGSHRRFDLESTYTGPDECGPPCCFSCCQPYRFTTVHTKAIQWVSLAKATAAALQTAIEKADGEALSSLRLAQERQMTELGLEVSKSSYRAADWDVQALDKQMIHAVTRLQYFQRLIEVGPNVGELGNVAATTASMASRTSATVMDGVGQGMTAMPDMWAGVAGWMGSPLEFNQLPVGVKLGTGFASAARILNTVADISGTSAGLSLTQAGWERREEEWQHTCDVTVAEIQQIKRQRLASRRRLDNALRELDNTQRRIEHSAEVQDFARDKTSRYELYLYLQQENSALYRQCYELALETAREAEKALRFELGDVGLSFISVSLGSWKNLHEGLVAGEKLDLALSSMERAHMNKHCREYELTKHVSLRLHFPAAFIMLKSAGHCEVDLPEWLFDLDYPGHYMRRIRSVSLTVPCVAGPYTGVHCKLQQLSSSIRFRPVRSTGGTCNCCTGEQDPNVSTRQTACLHDPHIWKQYAGTEAIATSAGQNDAGLFEVNFNDPRYLPFEYTGAVSRWRIELPPENNQFDFDSLSDLIMHINFTAREGGPEFARENSVLAQRHVPGDGWRFFDMRHEIPEAWNVVRKDIGCDACRYRREESPDEHCCVGRGPDDCRCMKDKHHGPCAQCHGQDETLKGWCEKCRKSHDDEERRCSSVYDSPGDQAHRRGRKKRPHHAARDFGLSLTRNQFPFLTGRRGVTITSLHLLFDTKECDPRTAKVRFTPPHDGEEAACIDTENIPLVPAEGGILKGSLVLKHPVKLDHPSSDARAKGELIGTFSLPCELMGVCGAWLLCGYDAREKSCEKEAPVGCCM